MPTECTGETDVGDCCVHQVLAHLLDMVFYSDEKEKVIPLLVNIMHYVVPYLRNHRWGRLLTALDFGKMFQSSHVNCGML